MRKIKKIFVSLFDEQRFFLVFRLIIALFLILLFWGFNNMTLSRYESDAEVNIAPKVAFFIADVGTQSESFQLGKILPSAAPYIYTFTVSNFENQKRTNVNMEYSIELLLTTNLPLNVKVFKSGTPTTGSGIVTSDDVISNADGMYFRKLVINEIFSFSYSSEQTDTYILWIEFPENYKYYSESYEGVVELVEINVSARQVV